jgi:EAL domain-containing protein (putative c-di-GMP-specific phosphodiesterase class I)
MQAMLVERMEMQSDLMSAVAAGEFVLYYQPVVDLSDGTISGVEALVRWNHPKLGLVMPGDFIGLAEANGSIVALGAWILRAACLQLVEWDRYGIGRHLDMSVNASLRQLEDPTFVDLVANVLNETQLDPRRLVLEITESALAQNIDDVVDALGRLRELGVRLAIDDFGTGYSSLSYLARMPVQVLKIDRSFIVEMETSGSNPPLVSSILELARGRGLTCVAEGIELTRVADELALMGCAKGQGYLFSPARPSADVARLLRDDQVRREISQQAESVSH